MPISASVSTQLRAEQFAALRATLSGADPAGEPTLPFGVAEIDERLADGGLHGAGLHEVAAASAALGDDAAATLFAAGIAARFAAVLGATVLWTLSRFDLYAPGLEQAGLSPGALLYAQGRNDSEALALTEDGLRSGAFSCVVAEVRSADRTATRRLQLAAADGRTPMLLYRRQRKIDRCALSELSSAMTRWRIGCVPSAPLAWAGVGRARWSIELCRQRNGNPFSLEVEGCDASGRLALPPSARNRTATPDRAAGAAGADRRAA